MTFSTIYGPVLTPKATEITGLKKSKNLRNFRKHSPITILNMGLFLTNGYLSPFLLPQTGSDVALGGGMDATSRALLEAAAQNGGLTDSYESRIPTRFLSGSGVSKTFAEIETLLSMLPGGAKRTALHEVSLPVGRQAVPHECLHFAAAEPNEENGIPPEEVEDLDISPAALLADVRKIFDSIRHRHLEIAKTMAEEEQQKWEKELALINDRLDHWEREILVASQNGGQAPKHH